MQLKIRFGKQDEIEEDEMNSWFQNNEIDPEGLYQQMSYIRTRPRLERLKYLRHR